MEEEELLPKSDLQELNPLAIESPVKTGFDAYKAWAGERMNNYGPGKAPDPSQYSVPGDTGGNAGRVTGGAKEGKINTIGDTIDRINATSQDSTKFAIKTSDISKRYPITFKGVDNESVYAEGQTTGQKIYNGVAKMVGIGTTTFINGTAGLVYGIHEAATQHKISAFYDNDLANYLNDINEDMEDTYAHYKTERERSGDWWEPSNLFTANFLFDNIVKNLGFSFGALAAGGVWGAGLKAIGMTKYLMGAGARWASAADAAIAEASVLPAGQRAAAVTSKLTQLYNSAKSGLGGGLMKADRGIVATFGTFGEAGMEALGNSRMFREKMIQDYRDKHGYDPDESELSKIDQEAESVGNWSFGLNTALLSATNYIQLPKIFSSSFKGDKIVANNIMKAGEHYVEDLPTKGFGKLMYKAKNLASLGFNTSEAFEEGAQYAIQTGTQNYFNRKYDGRETSFIEDGLLKGVKEALTTGEGTMNIFTGGISGAMQSAGVIGIKDKSLAFGKTGKIGERGWTGYGGEQGGVRGEATAALNGSKLKDKMRDAFANIKAAESIQQDREYAIRKGDILESKDLETDYAHTFIASRLKYGAKEFIDDEIKSMRQEASTEDGWLTLQKEERVAPTDTRDSFLKRLDNLQQHADHAARLYESANIKYGGLVDKEGNQVYTDEIIDKMVYAGSKVMDYDRRIPQLQQELLPYGINTDEILDNVINKGMDADEAMAEGKTKLDKAMNADALKTSLSDLVEISLRRKDFIEEYKDISKNPQKYHQVYSPSTTDIQNQIDAPEDTTVPETIEGYKTGVSIAVKTLGGDRTITTGKDYVLGRVVEYDKSGKEVYRAPRMTILGENPDGSVKVKLFSGEIVDIEKKNLEDYKLVPMSKIKSNDKLRFYMNRWNRVYEHYNIKQDGKPAKGRLEYHDEEGGKLMFVYLDRRKQRKEVEVTKSMFGFDKTKYKHAMLKHVGTLTAAEQQEEEDFAKGKDNREAAVVKKRMDIMIELSDELIDRQEKAEKLIASKRQQIENHKKEIETLEKIVEKAPRDKRYKNIVAFKKDFTRARERALSLVRTIDQLNQEILAQETLIEELDNNLNHIKEFIDNIDQLPVDAHDLVLKMRMDRIDLVEAIQSTGKNINMLVRARDAAVNLLESTVKIIRDLISAFENKYPGAPYSITQIEAENPDFLKLNENFKSDLEELGEHLEMMEDSAELPVKEKNIEDLNEKLDEAIQEFKNLENQLRAHDLILNKFKTRLAEYNTQKREEAQMARNQQVAEQLLGTNSKDIQNPATSRDYDPDSTKTWMNALAGTISPSGKKYDKETGQWVDSGEEIEEHHLRASRFGARVGVSVDAKNVFAYMVSSKTEKEAKLPGLIKQLIVNKKIDPESVLVAVFVRKNDAGEYELVDEFGEAIPEDEPNKLSKAIFQTFPGQDMPATGFRKDLSEEEIKDLKKQYNLWRNSELYKKELPLEPEPMDVSFGIPQYPTYKDEKGKDKKIYDTVTPAIKTGLITDNDLNNKKVVEVNTSGDVYEKGTSSYLNSLGRVFLSLPTGAVKLLNRKFNKKEAEVMYDAIYQLSLNVFNSGNAKNTEAYVLMDWLKSTVHWGIPQTQEKERKDAGYNSIWFEKVTDPNSNIESTRLFVSGLGENFVFTPSSIHANRDLLITIIQGMYNNANVNLVNKTGLTTKYKEIIGFKEGNPIFRIWPNYQTYLVSDKLPDPEGNMTNEKRGDDNIPWTSNMSAQTVEKPINREGVYFIRRNAYSLFKKVEPVAKQPETPKTETPVTNAGPVNQVATGEVKPAAKQTAVVTSSIPKGTYDLNGAPNIRPIYHPTTKKQLGGITFTFDGAKALELAAKDPTVLTDPAKIKAFSQELRAKEIIKINPINEQLETDMVLSFQAAPASIMASMYHNILKESIPQLIGQKVVTNAAENLPTQITTNTVEKAPVEKPVVKEPIGQVGAGEMKDIDPDDIPEDAWISQPSMENVPAVETVNTEEAGTLGPNFKPEAIPDEVLAGVAKSVEEKQPASVEVVETPLQKAMRMGLGKVVADKKPFKERVAEEYTEFDREDWGQTEDWLKQNFPFVPVYRIKNVIRNVNGRQVWGYFQRGAIYVYEGAETGTTYHEVFHAVWTAFAGPKEKTKIVNEFLSRPGTFIDRETLREVKYSDATPHQVEEKLAEEFRAKTLYGEDPVVYKGKNQGNLIKRLFDDLINFIKTFFTGRSAISNTEKLFNKIGNGYYRQINPYEYSLSMATQGVQDMAIASPGLDADMRIENISEPIVQDLIQHMTFLTLDKMVTGGVNLFAIKPEIKAELYDRIKKDILGDPEDMDTTPGILYNKISMHMQEAASDPEKEAAASEKIGAMFELIQNVELQWPALVERHQTYLRTFDLTFDENDELTLNKEEESNKAFEADARTVDAYRKSSPTVRLLLSSLPKTKMVNVLKKDEKGNDIIVPEEQIDKTPIGGYYLVPGDQVFNTLMNRLYDSIDSTDMLNRLADIAVKDPTYAHLYEILTKNPPNKKVASLDTSNYKQDNLQLISAFFKSFKKQNAEVIAVYVLPGGDVSIGDASLASAAKQVKSEYFNNTLYSLRKKDTYVEYNDNSRTYSATDKIKDYSFEKGDEESYLNLLKNLDINFTKEDYGHLDGMQRKLFKEIVPGIKKSISNINNFKSLTTKSVDLEGRLLQLASLKVIANKVASGDPIFESTYYNINNERSQSFIGVNLMSNFYDRISKLKNYKDLANTPFKYLRTDVFSKDKGSLFMNKLFDIAGDGTRREGTEGLGKTTYVDGTIDQESGKKKESSKLTYLQRFTQELSLNFNGYFSNLVPGDASIEWVVKMFHKDDPFVSETAVDDKTYLQVFKDYFIAEINLSRDNRTIPSVAGRSNKDLRFFKEILKNPDSKEPDALHDAILSSTATPEKVYEDFKTRIESAVERFVEKEAKDTRDVLKTYDLIKYNEEGNIEVKKVDLNLGEKSLTSELLNNKLKFISVNYMIANIEYHKLIYSDPYQYKDELKRIKNFNSPRQALITGDNNLMEAFSRTYNEGIDKDSPFYTDFTKDYFDTVTWQDGISANADLDYDPFEDTDGGGEIVFKSNRWFRILAGDWSDACESQFRHDVMYEEIAKGKGTAAEIQAKLDAHEKNNPAVSDAYRALKPIVAGAKENDRNYNDVVMDKYALVVSSFRIWHKLNPNSNAIKKYNKMMKERIDYGVYATGRKVGAEVLSPIYNSEGKFDETPYRNAEQTANPTLPQAVIKVPHDIIAVQAEVPTKTVAKTTEGSQLTQLATLDYMNAGMPIDFNPAIPGQEKMSEDALFNAQFAVWDKYDEDKKKEVSSLYREIANNKELLEVRIQQGYEKLLVKTGIRETPSGFYIGNRERLIDTLTDEILKREVNENIIEAFKEVKSGKVVMEATPAYKQIRNILYSMANQAVATKKISGKMAVQITERTLEEGDIKVTQVKNSKGKMIDVYNSDNLKFYKNADGERVCEIMVGRWFDSKKTDKELIEYLNTTDEGQKILQGIAFRIPTQKQNSIDSFVIKQFLPKEYGDNVVIPAALVKKVGSDFDIDKLSMYFKNVKENKDGFPELIKLKDDSNSNVNERYIEYVSEHIKDFKTKDIESDLDSGAVKEAFDVLDLHIAKALAKEEGLEDLDTFSQRSMLMQNTSKAVDNAYQESLFQLVTHPMNFERLVLPNSAKQLVDLNNEIQEALKTGETDYTSVGNMLKRGFMSKLRHAFVTGKQAIGIAAVGQTNNANNQKGPMVIEDERIDKLSDKDKKWIGDGSIKFSQFNSMFYKGKIRPTLSKAKNKAGEYISDIVGMFIDGYVDIAKGPWIMEMGATPNVAGTWLTLIKFGVPVRSVAMFMNQPIIKDYLKQIESAGYSYLFIDDFFNASTDSFEPAEQVSSDFPVIPNDKLLKDMIGKTPDELSNLQKAQQQFILKEFVKYAKISEHLFFITQGSNYNTATFNDPFLFLQKEMQLEKARRTVFSSVDNILDYTHIGVLKTAFGKIRNAFAELLISDKKTKDGGVMGTRELFTKLLMPYMERPSKEFLKISQKAVTDLFDWVIQTQGEQHRNKYVTDILIGTKGVDSAADAVMKYKAYVAGKPGHPLQNNLVLNSFQRKTNSKEGGIEALYINGKNSKVYEQNLIINSFRELQIQLDLEKSDLYQRIVGLTILQSGLSTSPISFTHLLPYEDFIRTYNELLVNLDTNPNLHKFLDLNVFERSNWSDSTIVPFKPYQLRKNKKGKFYNPQRIFMDPRLVSAETNKQIPMTIKISDMGQEGNYDVITYTWQPNTRLTSYEKSKMRREGDYSYMKKGLFKKVYTLNEKGERVPYIQKSNYKGITYTNYVYKQINAWGDSLRAKEMYDVLKPSLFDNGYEKVVRTPADITKPAETSGEVDDAVIINILGGYPGNVVPLEDVGPIDERVTKVIGVKYDPKFGVTEEEWNSYSTEEQQEIKDQNENC